MCSRMSILRIVAKQWTVLDSGLSAKVSGRGRTPCDSAMERSHWVGQMTQDKGISPAPKLVNLSVTLPFTQIPSY